MASKGWKVVQAHVPLIRFRNGGNSRVAAAAAAAAKPASAPSGAGAAVSSKQQGATGPNVVVLPIIEDFQLPLRFQRRPIDIKEIEYINRGGPE
ncbi:hypothetical protein TSAR_008332 [Trichomalopsis sarcophagae]|uniref:28S ribosomal protein S36, mitochondrial n=1 Tax=Trichomalopsis sarcophagae TaxID=543379 RepID=A0A232FCM0_9HYME|nr:hypothetical protein TSAR_008332 [Trichomalopsis sarcophagae]